MFKASVVRSGNPAIRSVTFLANDQSSGRHSGRSCSRSKRPSNNCSIFCSNKHSRCCRLEELEVEACMESKHSSFYVKLLKLVKHFYKMIIMTEKGKATPRPHYYLRKEKNAIRLLSKCFSFALAIFLSFKMCMVESNFYLQ